MGKSFIDCIFTKKEHRDFFMSTQFWGPLLTWSLPAAAIADSRKPPDIISPKLTTALALYSMMFMPFSLKVKPRNLFMFSCHFVNFWAQANQLKRFFKYRFTGTVD